MSVQRVRYTPQAFGHIESAQAWWLKNRSSAPQLLRDEFAASIRMIREFPDMGVPHPHRKIAGVRRYLLFKTQFHVYYAHVHTTNEIVVLAFWNALRGRNPPLRPPLI